MRPLMEHYCRCQVRSVGFSIWPVTIIWSSQLTKKKTKCADLLLCCLTLKLLWRLVFMNSWIKRSEGASLQPVYGLQGDVVVEASTEFLLPRALLLAPFPICLKFLINYGQNPVGLVTSDHRSLTLTLNFQWSGNIGWDTVSCGKQWVFSSLQLLSERDLTLWERDTQPNGRFNQPWLPSVTQQTKYTGRGKATQGQT